MAKGCVREYMITDGEEKTTNFFTEDQWVIATTGLFFQQKANFYWVCAEDCTLVVGNEDQAQNLFKDFPRFETISRMVMEEAFGEQNQRIASFLTHSPEQQYKEVLETRPDLLQRVPQYQLASYIGVKPESLSRIRKRLSL